MERRALPPSRKCCKWLLAPLAQVIIAVGGATYTNWAALNAGAIRRFVDAFGLDGVDIDYEVSGLGMWLEAGGGGMIWRRYR